MHVYVLVCIRKYLLVLDCKFNADILVLCLTAFQTMFNAIITVHTQYSACILIFGPQDGQRERLWPKN